VLDSRFTFDQQLVDSTIEEVFRFKNCLSTRDKTLFFAFDILQGQSILTLISVSKLVFFHLSFQVMEAYALDI
jgi:hypothetical protein